jgi:hypothetical protein
MVGGGLYFRGPKIESWSKDVPRLFVERSVVALSSASLPPKLPGELHELAGPLSVRAVSLVEDVRRWDCQCCFRCTSLSGWSR